MAQVFQYGERDIRVEYIDKAPWWVLVDVLRALDARVRCTDATWWMEKKNRTCRSVATDIGRRKVILVNESGLDAIIKRYGTEDFRQWVAKNILKRGFGKPQESTPLPKQEEDVPLPEIGDDDGDRLALQPSIDASLKRAAMLIRAAEHKAVPEDEQRRLISLAVREITGVGLASVVVPVPQEADDVMAYREEAVHKFQEEMAAVS